MKKIISMIMAFMLMGVSICHTHSFAAVTDLMTDNRGNIFFSPDDVELFVAYENKTREKIPLFVF